MGRAQAITFNQQCNTPRSLYSVQLDMPRFKRVALTDEVTLLLGYYPKRNLKSFPIARAKRLRRGSADRAYMVNKVGKTVCKPDEVWYTDYKKNLRGGKTWQKTTPLR